MQHKQSIPIACDITKLDADARAREQSLLIWFRNAYIDSGWTGSEFRFTMTSDAQHADY